MTRYQLGAGLAAAIAITAGCGDNAAHCGSGTVELDGVCTSQIAAMCGDGTRLENGLCVVDPATCQAGTVLIGDRCVDPTAALVVDLEESAEPNGRAVATGVEASEPPAGTIQLKPAGAAFVIHGHLTPFRDANADGQLDPDVDTYLITVTAPTLLDISVDGVGGAQGAFYVAGDPAGSVPQYERYGLNLTGDTSRRQLVLPAAGLYSLAIADIRSLAIGDNPPPPAGAGGAAGGAAAEYYASITVVELPAPASIALTGAVTTQTGALATGEVKLFSASLGTRATELRAVMPGAATASLAVILGTTLQGYADEQPATMSMPASPAAVPVTEGDSTAVTIVVDPVYNYGPAAEPFALTIDQTPPR